jgi:hypothetical protein
MVAFSFFFSNFSFKYCVFIYFSGISQEKKEMLLDFVEKYVMTGLYRILFCPPSTTDEEKDLSIQKR